GVDPQGPSLSSCLAAEGFGQIGRTIGRRLRNGLAPDGLADAVVVADRFPVAAAPIPGRGGQGGPVVVSRVRGQSGRGAFGAKGRVSPAQGTPDPVSFNTADRPQLVLHHLDPALR